MMENRMKSDDNKEKQFADMKNENAKLSSENKALKNVLPKNYASPDLDKRVLGEVVDLFTNNIKM